MKNPKIIEKAEKTVHLTLSTKAVAANWHIAYLYQGLKVTLGFGSTAQTAIEDAFASLNANA